MRRRGPSGLRVTPIRVAARPNSGLLELTSVKAWPSAGPVGVSQEIGCQAWRDRRCRADRSLSRAGSTTTFDGTLLLPRIGVPRTALSAHRNRNHSTLFGLPYR